MSEDQTVSYIKERLAEGRSKEEVVKILTDAGYSEEMINAAFSIIDNTSRIKEEGSAEKPKEEIKETSVGSSKSITKNPIVLFSLMAVIPSVAVGLTIHFLVGFYYIFWILLILSAVFFIASSKKEIIEKELAVVVKIAIAVNVMSLLFITFYFVVLSRPVGYVIFNFEEEDMGEIVYKEMSIGERIPLSEANITINTIDESFDFADAWGNIHNAKTNEKYVAVNLSISNTTSEPLHFYPLRKIWIEDEEGMKYEDGVSGISVKDSVLLMYAVNPRETSKGNLLYSIPRETRRFSIVLRNKETNEHYKVNIR